MQTNYNLKFQICLLSVPSGNKNFNNLFIRYPQLKNKNNLPNFLHLHYKNLLHQYYYFHSKNKY